MKIVDLIGLLLQMCPAINKDEKAWKQTNKLL